MMSLLITKQANIRATIQWHQKLKAKDAKNIIAKIQQNCNNSIIFTTPILAKSFQKKKKKSQAT